MDICYRSYCVFVFVLVVFVYVLLELEWLAGAFRWAELGFVAKCPQVVIHTYSGQRRLGLPSGREVFREGSIKSNPKKRVQYDVERTLKE